MFFVKLDCHKCFLVRFLLTAVAVLSCYSIHLLLKASGVVGKFISVSRVIFWSCNYPWNIFLYELNIQSLFSYTENSSRNQSLWTAGFPGFWDTRQTGSWNCYNTSEYRRWGESNTSDCFVGLNSVLCIHDFISFFNIYYVLYV